MLILVFVMVTRLLLLLLLLLLYCNIMKIKNDEKILCCFKNLKRTFPPRPMVIRFSIRLLPKRKHFFFGFHKTKFTVNRIVSDLSNGQNESCLPKMRNDKICLNSLHQHETFEMNTFSHVFGERIDFQLAGITSKQRMKMKTNIKIPNIMRSNMS